MWLLPKRLWKEGKLSRLPSLNPLWPCALWFAISSAAGPSLVAALAIVLIGAPLLVALLARRTEACRAG